jgi:hypothetical protein
LDARDLLTVRSSVRELAKLVRVRVGRHSRQLREYAAGVDRTIIVGGTSWYYGVISAAGTAGERNDHVYAVAS